jgi:hypothetical protein
MKTTNCMLVAVALATAVSCAPPHSAYYYDPYYGWVPYVYDDAYYDAIMLGGYYDYYYPVVTFLSLAPETAAPAAKTPPFLHLLLGHWNAPIDAGCVTTTPSADEDKDGIPANATVTLDCSGSPGNGSAKVTGSLTIMDLDDRARDAGYAVTFHGLSVHVTTAAGAVTERVLDGDAAISKSGGELHLTRQLLAQDTDTFPDGVQRKNTLEMKGEGTFTLASGMGESRVARGSLSFSGEATFTGSEGTTYTITRRTDPALGWSRDCSKQTGGQGFDSGAVEYKTSHGGETRVVHQTCSAMTVTRGDGSSK